MGPSINGLRQEPLPPGEPFSVPKMDGLFLLIGGGGGTSRDFTTLQSRLQPESKNHL